MGVRIDKSGGDAAAFGIDYGCVFRHLGAQFGVAACRHDTAILDQQQTVVHNGKIAQFLVGARACRPGEGD
jgi:hypothetical protein